MKIFCSSDLHVDFPDSRKWISSYIKESIVNKRHDNDIMIIVGDVTDNLELLRDTLLLFKSAFKRVFFIAGNHELWVKNKKDNIKDSYEKLKAIQEMMKENNIGGYYPELIKLPNLKYEMKNKGEYNSEDKYVLIVGLYSWYDDSLYVKLDDSNQKLDGWSDTFFCRWDKSINYGNFDEVLANADSVNAKVSKYMCKKNTHLIDLAKSLVSGKDGYLLGTISFTHMLPRLECLPYSGSLEDIKAKGRLARDKHYGFNFSKVAGSKELDRQIRCLPHNNKNRIHIFGHSHRAIYKGIDGIEYINHPFGYPSEREKGSTQVKQPFQFMCCYDSREAIRSNFNNEFARNVVLPPSPEKEQNSQEEYSNLKEIELKIDHKELKENAEKMVDPWADNNVFIYDGNESTSDDEVIGYIQKI